MTHMEQMIEARERVISAAIRQAIAKDHASLFPKFYANAREHTEDRAAVLIRLQTECCQVCDGHGVIPAFDITLDNPNGEPTECPAECKNGKRT